MTPPTPLRPTDSTAAVGPITEPGTPPPESAHDETPTPSTWSRFHLLTGGGYNFTGRLYADSETYERAAPAHQGGFFFVQPGFSVFSSEHWDVRLGLHYGHHFLSTPKNSPNDSNFQMISAATFLEGTYLPHTHFGIGAQGRIGYSAFSASSVDVGLPVTANFSFGSDGNLGLGASLFLTTWNQALRLGANLETIPGGVKIDLPSPALPLPVQHNVQWGVFGSIDLFRVIQNF